MNIMAIVPYLVSVWLFLAGVYGIASSRNTVQMVSCLFVAQSSTYVLLLSVGYRKGATAPISSAAKKAVLMVDPVVQALTLTDIVVGVTVSALILAFAVQAYKRAGSVKPERFEKMKG